MIGRAFRIAKVPEMRYDVIYQQYLKLRGGRAAQMPKNWRNRLFDMVSVGVIDDPVNRFYDIISTVLLVANLFCAMLNTIDSVHAQAGWFMSAVETVSVTFFLVDYILRVITARKLYPKSSSEGTAILRYVFSASGLIDLLSFLPYYLPVFFPSGAAAFRMFRVIRIFRLFRINAYYDSLNVITDVLKSKKQQLLSSVFIILVLMLASSLCMYSVEHDAQPEVFKDAFSGIWWSASTLLTVGYGDIYPVTKLGKAIGTLIAFLGVGMVAIPTGIISAGFVEQYTKLKEIGDSVPEEEMQFIQFSVSSRDDWCGRRIMDLNLPRATIIGIIRRGQETVIPKGETVIEAGDIIMLGAEAIKEGRPVRLVEMKLGPKHHWSGECIKDLNISRQTHIIMVKRSNTALAPRGDLKLREGDIVYVYSKLPRITF